MKFGLFYEHQLPSPYDKEQWELAARTSSATGG